VVKFVFATGHLGNKLFLLKISKSSPPLPLHSDANGQYSTRWQVGGVGTTSVGLHLSTPEVKQLLSTSTSYAGGANSCFLNQPLRWWYITIYAGGTTPRWWCRHRWPLLQHKTTSEVTH